MCARVCACVDQNATGLDECATNTDCYSFTGCPSGSPPYCSCGTRSCEWNSVRHGPNVTSADNFSVCCCHIQVIAGRPFVVDARARTATVTSRTSSSPSHAVASGWVERYDAPNVTDVLAEDGVVEGLDEELSWWALTDYFEETATAMPISELTGASTCVPLASPPATGD